MKKNMIRLLLRLVLVGIVLSAYMFMPTWTHKNPAYEHGVYELREVMINKVPMRILIRGSSRDNPVLLFVSHGFESELSYIRKYEETLEQFVSVVHFDLRGTGATPMGVWDDNETYLSMLVSDVIQLTTYLQREFDVAKIILAGHGTGSVIAMQALMASQSSYQAYVGISQIGSFESLAGSILERLKAEIDEETWSSLHAHLTQSGFLDEAAINKIKPESILWNKRMTKSASWLFGSEANGWHHVLSAKRAKEAQGKFYETINTAGATMGDDIDVPLYFIGGRYDYLVPMEASKAYMGNLSASKKSWTEFSASAHYPHLEESSSYAFVIKKIVAETSSRVLKEFTAQ